MIVSVFDTVENIVRKGKIACTSNLSFSHNNFKRLLSQTHQKVSLSGNGSTQRKKKRLLLQTRKNQGLLGEGLSFHGRHSVYQDQDAQTMQFNLDNYALSTTLLHVMIETILKLKYLICISYSKMSTH